MFKLMGTVKEYSLFSLKAPSINIAEIFVESFFITFDFDEFK